MSKAGKYIGDFSNISTVTQIILAIFEIYQRKSEYISDFPNISIYRQKATIRAVPNGTAFIEKVSIFR
ncbi:hypothetical protein [Bacillus cereus]|uniref:hypothetical protein n=1 Tax=Bacillus cereus TaxID=1396 RepID=UPI0024069561|nr:hypothetical protein [Bacillus cereus]